MMRKLFSVLIAIVRDLFGGAALRELFDKQPIQSRSMLLAECLESRVADRLVAQAVDREGRFVASRGYHLYRYVGQGLFEFTCRIPCPLGFGQLFRLPRLRDVLGKQDIIQLFYSRSGAMIVQSGGVLYRKGRDDSPFRRVFRLRFWGRAGRGVLHNGIEQTASGRILLGEYFNNPQRQPVRIYASDDDGVNWIVAYEFQAKSIRHVHAIQQDPYQDYVWVCVGDTDEESQILRSGDNGATFEVVGQGSQGWRCCTLLFTEDYVYWGADTESNAEYRHLYRYRRSDGTVQRMAPTDGAIEFAVFPCPDLQIYATTRAGYGNVPDDQPSLLINKGDRELVRIRLEPRIHTARGRAGGTKLYYSSSTQQVCLSFTNIACLDGMIAVVPLSEFRRPYKISDRRCSVSHVLELHRSDV